MRAFDNTSIEQALEYGSCEYTMALYKNGTLLDIDVDKIQVHFMGSKVPVGCITKHYMTMTTTYADIVIGDVIRMDITAYGKTVTIGEWYITDFDKKTDTKTYTAYSSDVDLTQMQLDAMATENMSESIETIVAYYMNKNGITFTEAIAESNMKFYVESAAGITLNDLISDYGKVHMCNFIQLGSALKPVYLDGNHSEVTYDQNKVVYSNNFAEYSDELTLDYVNIKYTEFFYEEDSNYVCQEANIMAKRNDSPADGIDIEFSLIPYTKNDVENLAGKYAKSMADNLYNLNDYTVSFLGDPRPEIGDIVNIRNGEVIKPVRAGQIDWKWDGSLSCTASTGPNNASTGSGISLQQMENTLRRVSTELLTVKYNAVYTNELYAKVAEVGFLTAEEFNVASKKMDESITQIKKQLNNELEAYIGDPRPTASNYPASEWTDDQKIQNVGTKYYCQDGTSWQWMYYELAHSDSAISHSGNILTHYYWMQLSDSAVGEALANANDALKQIGDLSTKMIRDYYTKTETDASFKATNEGIESLANRTDTVEANIESVDGKFSNYVTKQTYDSGLKQTAQGFQQYVEENYTTKTEFGNMKVGGANLILNSLNFIGSTHFVYMGKLAHNDVLVTHRSINLVH